MHPISLIILLFALAALFYIRTYFKQQKTQSDIQAYKDAQASDDALLAKIAQHPRIKQDFQSIFIRDRIAFYKQVEEGRYVLISVKKGKIRLGKLFNFFVKPGFFHELKIDFSDLYSDEPQAGELQVIGTETGYMFGKITFEQLSEWRSKYDEFVQLMEYKDGKKREKSIADISIETYKDLIESVEYIF